MSYDEQLVQPAEFPVWAHTVSFLIRFSPIQLNVNERTALLTIECSPIDMRFRCPEVKICSPQGRFTYSVPQISRSTTMSKINPNTLSQSVKNILTESHNAVSGKPLRKFGESVDLQVWCTYQCPHSLTAVKATMSNMLSACAAPTNGIAFPQVNLKNYDTQKDKRFAGSVKLPRVARPRFSVCIIADAAHGDAAMKLGVPVKTVDDLKKLNKNKKLVKKLCQEHDAFLASDSLIKNIPRIVGTFFLGHTMCKFRFLCSVCHIRAAERLQW